MIIIIIIVTNKRNPNAMTWTWLRKENSKREAESLLIAGQNNGIRTN